MSQDAPTVRRRARDAADCLLLNPPDDFSRYPYLGLCSLAASLRQRGVRVEILDSAALGYGVGDVLAHVEARRPRLIGLSAMSMTLPFSYRLLQGIGRCHPDGIVVVGGAHVNADPEILRSMGVPYGFRGECERTFADFGEQVLGGGAVPEVPGLIRNDDGRVIAAEPSIVDDLDSLPMPAYDLLPLERYYSPSTAQRAISFISSRGCPYNCAYCSKLERTRYRSLSAETVARQLEVLVGEHGMRWIEFVDEIFTLDRRRVVALCHAILDRELAFEWGAGTRPDHVDDELFALMRQAGCRKIGFGIETGVERVRFAVHKKITNDRIAEAVRLARKHGLKVMGSFIFGHPTETEAEMRQTVSFARKLGLNFAYFNKMIPIPNSELFETAKRQGAVSDRVWEDFMLGRCPYPIYTPEGADPQTVGRIYRRAWFSMYLWPPNIWRNRSIFLNPRHLWRSAKAFSKSSSERRYEK